MVGIVLLTLASVFIYGFHLVSRMKQVSLATQVAQKKMEIIRNLPFEDLETLGATFSDENLARLKNGTGVLAVEDEGSLEIKKVTVSILWDFHGRSMRKDIVTFVTQEGLNRR
jgi:uncharacterized membrane protein YheB (UPF0754 family)